MVFCNGFDEANQMDRKERMRRARDKAKQLNGRLKMFLLEKAERMSKSDVDALRKILIEGI